MNTYFLTGATGVVGSAITEALATSPDVQLKLLIRASSQVNLRSRLDTLIDYWGVERERVADRVEALLGDATEPLFGLGRDTYSRLANQCTHVIHSAGAVRMNLKLEDARRSAVGSAKHVLAFADACQYAGQLCKVEFISTVGVGGRLPGTIPERWITEPRRFHNTYEQAKAEAEVLVAQAVRGGLPATVHRPSMVVGDSRTGKVMHFQVFYHLAEFLSGQRTFGLLPNTGQTRLDLVPADYVAAAVLWSSTRSDTAGQILHLCAGPDRALDIRDLREQVCAAFRDAGIQLPRSTSVPAAIFRAALPVVRLLSSERHRRALDTLPIFLDYLKESQAFAADQTEKVLRRADIPIPSPAAFLPKVLGYYLERGRTPKGQ